MDSNSEEFGMCDECGDYTTRLYYVEGEWQCKTCTIGPDS